MTVLGVDIGGAYTKVASSDFETLEIHYLPLWKHQDIRGFLESVDRRLKPSLVGVVMTGELADCFPDKEQGARFLRDAALGGFKCEVKFIDQWGRISDGRNPRGLAAANWSASAAWIAREFPDTILVDMGSTTTDIIPIQGGRPRAGVTDLERLGRGELIYAGVLRTNPVSILNQVELRGKVYRLASEYFAINADVYLLLGDIKEEDYTCPTPDGRAPGACSRRLARLLCADTSELSPEEITGIARQIRERQIQDLAEALTVKSREYNLGHVSACGMGEFLIKEAAKRAKLKCTPLSDLYGERGSRLFPALATARLVRESHQHST